MKNFKFTGVNISAAVLIIAFFLPWFSAMGMVSMSGFSITTTGISPGMLSWVVKGIDRLLMILLAVVPLSGALILYQHITGNKRFEKYYKPAHFIPAAVMIAGMILIYFKMKPEVPDLAGEDYDGYSRALRQISRSASEMAPGLFDVLAVGVYISLAAAVYLLLVAAGKVKDKEYYTPAATASTGEKETTGQASDTTKTV